MAKDGSGRGGARPGAGRKPKALIEKISEGKTAEVLMEPAELEGVDVPPVKDFLKSPQKSGRELVAEEVFNETYAWLKARGCEKLVTVQMVEQYAMSVSRWIQCEEIVSSTGFLAKHPTTGAAIASPYVSMSQAYGICSKDSNAMKSDNPHSGFYEAQTARTLDCNCNNPSANQGGIAVVEPEGMSAFHINQRDEVIDLHGKSGALMATRNMQMQTFVLQGSMIGRGDKNGPQGSGINEDVAFSLTAADRHAVAQPTYCTSKNSHFTRAEKELANTLVATDYKDPPVINDVKEEPDYIVRRLTPTECARLQGFPDWWCDGLGTENPAEDELAFWREVFETHRKVMGTSKKPKTDRQILKWLKDPHSDSAEYKMWGNGIALPNAYFVLAGIVYYAQFPDFLL